MRLNQSARNVPYRVVKQGILRTEKSFVASAREDVGPLERGSAPRGGGLAGLWTLGGLHLAWRNMGVKDLKFRVRKLVRLGHRWPVSDVLVDRLDSTGPRAVRMRLESSVQVILGLRN